MRIYVSVDIDPEPGERLATGEVVMQEFEEFLDAYGALEVAGKLVSLHVQGIGRTPRDMRESEERRHDASLGLHGSKKSP